MLAKRGLALRRERVTPSVRRQQWCPSCDQRRCATCAMRAALAVCGRFQHESSSPCYRSLGGWVGCLRLSESAASCGAASSAEKNRVLQSRLRGRKLRSNLGGPWLRLNSRARRRAGKPLIARDCRGRSTYSSTHLLEGSFVDRHENLLAFGNPGSGKTHLLCAIGQELIHRGHRVLFTTCSLLVQELLMAKRELRLARLRRCCTALAESEIRLWWWPRYVRA